MTPEPITKVKGHHGGSVKLILTKIVNIVSLEQIPSQAYRYVWRWLALVDKWASSLPSEQHPSEKSLVPLKISD